MSLHSPSMSGMLPVKIFDLLLSESSKFGIDISLVSLLVVIDLPEVESDAKDEDGCRGSQIETVADRIIRSIERQD